MEKFELINSIVTEKVSFEKLPTEQIEIFSEDADIMIVAIEQNSQNISFVSNNLFNNPVFRKFCLVHIHFEDLYNKMSLSQRHQLPQSFVEALMKHNSNFFEKLDYQWKINETIAFTALNNSYDTNFLFECFPEELLDNKKFVIQYLSENFDVYDYLSIELKKDKEVLFELLQFNLPLMKRLPSEIRYDIDFVSTVVHKNIELLHFIEPSLLSNIDFIEKITAQISENKEYIAINFIEIFETLEKIEHNNELQQRLEQINLTKSNKLPKKKI